MAGTQLGKHKGGGACKALFRHTTKDVRAKSKHSNPHLDTNLTHLNTSIHGLETGTDYSYAQMCSLYDEKIEEADEAGSSTRKDRVTMLTFISYAPEGLPEDKQDEWFLKVADIQRGLFGADNFIDGHIDRDEQHEYVDPDTEEVMTSRVHMCSYIIPRKEDGKLCAKDLTKRSVLIKQNKLINEMSIRDYGVEYVTGKGKKSNESVEQLKEKSMKAEAELLAKELEDGSTQLAQLQETIGELKTEEKKAIAETELAIADRDANIESAERIASLVKDKEREANEKLAQKQSQIEAIDEREKNVAEREKAADDYIDETLTLKQDDFKDWLTNQTMTQGRIKDAFKFENIHGQSVMKDVIPYYGKQAMDVIAVAVVFLMQAWFYQYQQEQAEKLRQARRAQLKNQKYREQINAPEAVESTNYDMGLGD